MQTENRFFDDFARLTSGMAGLAAGFRQEIEQVVRARMQSVLADMDLVPREDFEAVRAMAEKARLEQEQLSARLAELEAKRAGTALCASC